MPFLYETPKSRLAEINKNGILDTFHKLVQDLSDLLGPTSGIDSEDIDPQQIIQLMKQYKSSESHWHPYAFSDPCRNYTRNLVDEGNGKSNLLILVWNPGKGSVIHDHADAHCIMKILRGTLQETVYDRPDVEPTVQPSTAPTPQRTTVYRRDEVTYISDAIGIHKITNPSPTEVAVSLHLYTPPHAASYGYNVFCEKTGKQTHCDQAGVFSDRGRVRLG